ncbi:hypothetical protein NDU88_002555 [Pleurodeles waltl]|uniref:Uncharacterized protein n=1 Tax=Pleurodeles waltl TaxID=8319 RepID=A0AAV7VE58_PLEWA|nr:hypothetical protein NDU88_002555 [Pleurodeles waltl]
MRLVFERAVPSGESSGPAGSAGAPSDSTSAASAPVPLGTSGSDNGSGPAPVSHSRPPSAPGPTSTIPPPAPTGGSPILIPDDPERRRTTSTPTSTEPIRPRSLSEHYLEQPDAGEEWEGSEDPLESGLQQDWYVDLGEASGLDTSPDTGMLSPPNVATEEGASFAMVVRRAAEVLDLKLPTVPVRTNILTEVLQPGVSTSELLLPFNEALTDVLLGTWSKPSTEAPVNRTIGRRDRPAPSDPSFLTQHPTPESLVVQASTSRGAFPSAPPDRESKRLDQLGKKMFSSSSLALRSVNTSCLLGRYSHTLWDMVAQVLPQVPEGVRDTLTQAVKDGRDAAKFTIRCGLDTTDSLGRAISSSVALRRHAWLRSTGFSGDVQPNLMDMPFDGSRLFGEKADSALERFKDSRATARSLGLSAPA